MINNNVEKTIIIGAGPAGLSTAYELTKLGISPLVLEKTQAIGDVWRNHYDGLRLNSGNRLSQLPGSPFPSSASAWPTREEMVNVLQTFPERGSFCVQTNIEVTAVEYDRSNDFWTVAASNGKQWNARTIVVATGGARIPVLPNYEGMNTFSGDIIHSSKFKNGEIYQGKHMLVIGSGNSAAEIASRLVPYAASVTLSARTPPHILPKSIYGIPLVAIGIATRYLPIKWVDSLLGLLQRVLIGDLTLNGLPYPKTRLSQQFTKTQVVPILYAPFVDDVRAGKIRIVGPVQRIQGNMVYVSDGIETKQRESKEINLKVDAIVAGTGYRTGIANLVKIPGITTHDDRVVVSAEKEFSDAPRLYFVGQINPLSGQLREIRLESARVARKIQHRL